MDKLFLEHFKLTIITKLFISFSVIKCRKHSYCYRCRFHLHNTASNFLKSYAIDCAIIGFNFSMMGYLNGCGQILFVSLQGISSTFLVRIPVSFMMSKIPGVSLFQVGLATPCATVFAIVITSVYLWFYTKKKGQKA